MHLDWGARLGASAPTASDLYAVEMRATQVEAAEVRRKRFGFEPRV